MQGFRALVNEDFALGPLTVFTGEMGSGKTSRLLAILFGLTGATAQGLTLDELIHVDSEFMWVRLTGRLGERSFTVERRKKRGQASVVKADPDIPMVLDERVFLEGREITRVFSGAPSEKAMRIDSLLGLSRYDELASEITPAPVERRIASLIEIKQATERFSAILEGRGRLMEEIEASKEKIKALRESLDRSSELYQEAEAQVRRGEEFREVLLKEESRRKQAEALRAQVVALTSPPAGLEDELKELEAKHSAMLRRVTFLEAVLQTLDLEGKKIEEIKLCPVCGAFISPKALEQFRHYDEEYKQYASWISDLENLVGEKRKLLEDAKSVSERRRLIEGQLADLERDAVEIDAALKESGVENAKRLLRERDTNSSEMKELEIRLQGLLEQQRLLESTFSQVSVRSAEEVEARLEKLRGLVESLKRIKAFLLESVAETRLEQVRMLESSFKETFRKLYPYPRISDVAFETVRSRGREVIQFKAKRDGSWVYPNQMSTGENVAISFALTYSANKLGSSPILLLDEPEEGLDDNGVRGLADVLNKLKETTQAVVATRSGLLADSLTREG